jgi:hypothetical protein
MSNLIIAFNHSTDDLEYGISGVDWQEVNLINDKLILSNGSDTIADEEPFPDESDLTAAGIILDGTEQVVSKYLLANLDENKLQEIFNMGNTNKRYVMAFNFDAATASEPRLELWDDSNLNTVDLVTLGAGSPTNSFWKGITTTGGLPGADWVGSSLAGSSSGHFLWLNNLAGPLTTAGTLYCNLKVVIPSTCVAGSLQQPVFCVKYTSN